jgi:hypothetical protein
MTKHHTRLRVVGLVLLGIGTTLAFGGLASVIWKDMNVPMIYSYSIEDRIMWCVVMASVALVGLLMIELAATLAEHHEYKKIIHGNRSKKNASTMPHATKTQLAQRKEHLEKMQ